MKSSVMLPAQIATTQCLFPEDFSWETEIVLYKILAMAVLPCVLLSVYVFGRRVFLFCLFFFWSGILFFLLCCSACKNFPGLPVTSAELLQWFSWPFAMVREMSLKVHCCLLTDGIGKQERESKELLPCLHILVIESFWRLKMRPASLLSSMDFYTNLYIVWYLCPSVTELLFHFSMICIQWKKCVFKFKHMHIQKQVVRLEKNISQYYLLFALHQSMMVRLPRSWCLSQPVKVFVLYLQLLQNHISTLTLVYPKVQSVHSHFTSCITFPGDFSP